LALAPNIRRFRPGFVDRVLRFAVPAGVIVAAAVFVAYAYAHAQGLSLAQQRTEATIVVLVLSLYVLVLVAWPLTWRRLLLVIGVLMGFVSLFPLARVRKFFDLELPHGVLGITLLIGAVGVGLLTVLAIVLRKRDESGQRLHGSTSS
jgi:cation-transporting ATPase E